MIGRRGSTEAEAFEGAEEAALLGPLGSYLTANLGVPGPFELRRFTAGRSNVTYLLTGSAGELVVRCPPFQAADPGAHDMAREHRVLSALWRSLPFVPRPLWLCEDRSVIGRPFHVMEHRRGIPVRSTWPNDLSREPALRRRIGESLISTLAALHDVDATSPPVSELGRPTGFLQRQVTGWSRRWHAATTRALPVFDELMAWLEDAAPMPQRAAVVHNDFKLGNVLLDESDPGHVAALLDWELCTLGDPLVDLGGLLAYWGEPGDHPARFGGVPPVTALPGFPRRGELVERYADATGLDLSAIPFYEIFGTVRLAAICEQLYGRFQRGQAHDLRLAEYEQQVPALLAYAVELVGRH